MILEEAYSSNPKPDKQARLDIVQRVSLNEKEVQVWQSYWSTLKLYHITSWLFTRLPYQFFEITKLTSSPTDLVPKSKTE